MTLLPALTAQARAAAHPPAGGAPCTCGEPTAPLADRPDATVVRHADTVAKAHAPGTDPAALTLRLAVAARLPDVLLPPLTPAPTPLQERLVTFWPYGAPVDPDDPDAAPWEATATLLARLHRTTPPDGLPPMRGPAKAARAIVRLHTALRATPRAEPHSEPYPEPSSVPPAEAPAGPQAAPSSVSPAEAHVEPWAEPRPEPQAGAHAGRQAEPPSGSRSGLRAGPQAEPPSDSRAGLRAGPQAEAQAGPHAEPPSGPHAEPPSEPPGEPHAELHLAARPVLAAWAALPAWARGEAPMPGTPALCHGDLHLGQLVRHPVPDGPWRLIDVDDLGTGVPAWDLARPAAWYACGLLPPDTWTRFLGAYQRAGGPAVPPAGDPWPALDVPARALTVQTAALALAKALTAGRPLDEVEQAVVDACARMAPIPHPLASTDTNRDTD
ncbi:phosphotransferase [Streptomyces sp. NPDC049099]|uniref:phosphotransferase n=1 Tax=Streptomyces sp. NPDC049099 TaxID=3155768 RepID=UPI00343656A6